MGRQRAPPPTDSGAQQVLRGLRDQPEIPWKCKEHVGSHIAEDCLRSQQGGRVLGDSNAASVWRTVGLLCTRCVHVIMHWPFSRIIGHIVGLSETFPVAKMVFSYPWLIYSFEPEKHSKQTQWTFYCLNGNTRLQPIHGSFITPSPAYCWGLNGLVRFQQVCYFRTNGNSGAQLFSVSCTKKLAHLSVSVLYLTRNPISAYS